MKIKFLNKAVDAINPPVLLQSTISLLDKEPLIVSYEYIIIVVTKLFNFASVLSNVNVSDYVSNSQTCQSKESKFSCEPLVIWSHGHW